MILLQILLLPLLNLHPSLPDEEDDDACIELLSRPVLGHFPETCPACDADAVLLIRVTRKGDGDAYICSRCGWEIVDDPESLQP
jgi:predicted RNA-binding Zn-ribbon protein involved in translation (DUF1610 family)